MGDYTKIDTARASDILQLYELGRVQELHPLSLGISNSNYRVVTDHGTWLLKVCNDKSIDQLKEEQEILRLLKEKQFPYSLVPTPTKSGTYVYERGEYYGVIYPFVYGEAPTPNGDECRQMGEALATLHQLSLTEEDKKRIRPYERIGQSAQNIRDYVASSRCTDYFKDAFNKIFPDQLETYLQIPVDKTLVHGDLYYDNTLFKNGKLVSFIDFEQSGWGNPLLDVGISISGSCLKDGLIDFSLVKAYLKGYQSGRSLPQQEKELLVEAINLGFFSISLWRIARFLEGDLDPSKAESYKELIEKAVDFSKRAPIEFESD